MTAAANRDLLALINVAPIAREAVERHQREVLDQYEPSSTASSTDAHQQAIADNNALNDAAARALHQVADFPATTAADLHAKLSFMVEHDMGDGMDWLPELLADAERLTGKGAAA